MSNIPNQLATNNSDYVEGDTVVFIDANKPDHLMTVTQVQKNGVLLDGNNSFALNHLIRHATVAEFVNQRRMPALTTFSDDQYLENNISPKCKFISSDVQIHLSNAMAAKKEVS
ncbi:MAG: hypothetical protein [Podoviridae sp. ctbh1]|nr:MAG: hypothetical protein [Podoviridae sp. ctbh1]